MSPSQERFERLVADMLADVAPSRPPNELIPHAEQAVSGARRRSRWLASIKEPPMRYASTVAVGSPTARVAAIMVATLLIALMVAGAGFAGSRLLAAEGTIVVDQSGNGTVETISAAVAMANDGETILVRPGTYDESVTVTEDITIRGDGDRDTIIVELSVEIPPGASGSSPDLPFAFLFDGSDATLENLTVRGESARIVISGGAPALQDVVLDGIGRVYSLDPGQPTPTGLEFNDGSTATVTNSVLSDTDVDIETGSSPTISGNEFSVGAIWMEGAEVAPVIRDNLLADSVKWGISVNAGARPTIEANTITNARVAVEVTNSGFLVPAATSEAIVRGNTISGATSAGISVSSGASATIVDNVLLDNGVGISVRSDVLVEGNRVEGGGGGISVSSGSPTLIDNSVEGVSGPGIAIGPGTSPSLSGNTSCDNGEDLFVAQSADPQIDETNTFCDQAPTDG